jgi:hypothetical protein
MSDGQDEGTLNEFPECSYVQSDEIEGKEISFRFFRQYLSHIKAHKICNSEEKPEPTDEQDSWTFFVAD